MMVWGALIFFCGVGTGAGLFFWAIRSVQDFKYRASYGMPVKGGEDGETAQEAEADSGTVLVPWNATPPND